MNPLQSVQCIWYKGIPHLRVSKKANKALIEKGYKVCLNYMDNFYINTKELSNKDIVDILTTVCIPSDK